MTTDSGVSRTETIEAIAAAVLASPAVAGLHGADLDALVSALQSRLQQVPGDAPAWATLALAYVEQARTSGDPTLYTRAAAAAITMPRTRCG